LDAFPTFFFRHTPKTPLSATEARIPDIDIAQIPADWPGRTHSRFVEHGALRWHLQQRGQGPLVLLVHGTGGATHSWEPCAEALATSHTVLAVDLPGHGFTTRAPSTGGGDQALSLQGMAAALGGLLRALELAPTLVAGHSAGVAVLMQLALDGYIAPARIVGFNPALVPPPQLYVSLLAPILGAIVETDAMAQGGAWLARATGAVDLMLSSSGSTLTAEQLARYRWLCERPEHVHAALTMMSRWDLPQLLRDAHGLRVPLELIGGTRDRWVPSQALARTVDRIPMARFDTVDAGHLIPDERPEVVVERLQRNSNHDT
jgi:magnesium chelatase accessory protein